MLDEVLTFADRRVLEADEGDREHPMRDAHARHEDLRPADGGLIDHDGDPSVGVIPEREPDEQRRHLGAVEGGVAQQAVEPLGPGLLGLVERQGAGQGAEREPPIAAARAAPELEHRDGQQGEAEGQPPSEVGGRNGQEVQHALDRGRLFRLERAAGAPRAPVVVLAAAPRRVPASWPTHRRGGRSCLS